MTAQSDNKEEGVLTFGYKELLNEVKDRVRSAQIKAATAVNVELIKLYWEIGRSIQQKQDKEGWGAKTIGKLAQDLKSAFPDMRGFSSRNLHLMAQFAREYSGVEIMQQAVAQIPWGHNAILLQRLNHLEDRIWYAQKTIENGWSRNVLVHWIDSKLHERQGKAISNFSSTLAPLQSDLATQTLKDPYCFDFLALKEPFDERELENGLLNHIQKFLLELGAGFAFVGRQYHLAVGDQDFYLDLLFYHLKLRCFVVIELKAGEFKPEYAGKMNFYLTALDETLKHTDDQPSIGLLLCKTKNKVVAEYALRDINKPLGIAQYEAKLVESLPDDFKSSLPTIEEIEAELKTSD